MSWFELKLLSLKLMVEWQFGLREPQAASVILQVSIPNKVKTLEAFAFIPSLLWGLICGSGEAEKSCQHHISGDTREFLPPWNVTRGHNRPWIGPFETQASSYPIQHRYHQSLWLNFPLPRTDPPRPIITAAAGFLNEWEHVLSSEVLSAFCKENTKR